ncbi:MULTISPECIES: TIGR03085 family metal-binding protein [Mycobacterium]|uniref:TIGR03085 family protein n=1 Tax=Mycobacterium kiyosense TaxID=2871094 RepID=A0A9P3Q8V4_9MYCO|nr:MULTISPECIES: TIGR03085 family metal-binding protein [Mycobacterium]BDB43785.1 TIGR03085 family protein [Mycobacterium kiyosense]BDE15348.1 TIGR03085 family protein [Mycobacterium sp. 20KCMC460]GLB82764.1 TIGR03085 family protein [Mycobacterium kiyosense]GLB90227.1 TIGR03085 family protein [Mycobacterium kiyosense]GLB95816.1 TIGR03085 family protein [Mycobacterium kiyosense]
MSVARRERAALVETMRSAGPDAPTLCEGWDTRDLAAHLVIREYRPDAAPGILIPYFAGHTDKLQNKVAQETDWETLVDKVASGPPAYSPFKLLDAVANVAEMFIHNEDVRRAQPGWEPRELEPKLVERLRKTVPLMGRLTLSKVPGRVALRTNDGKTILIAGHGPAVTVTGNPEELLLFAVGRTARVDFEGDESAVQAVKDAPKGL